MRSSISSFRKGFLLVYAALGGAAAFYLTLIGSPQTRARVLGFDRYDFRAAINKTKPDLILVGNSLLYNNVDRTLLESLLKEKLKRKVKVLFLADGGTCAAWWYLVLKREVGRSEAKDIPVGIFFSRFDLSNNRINEHQMQMVGKLLPADDDVFVKKTGGRYRSFTALSNELPDRLTINRYLLSNWLKLCSCWIPRMRRPSSLLEQKFQLGNLRPFGPDVAPRSTLDTNFNATLQQSFLPDMIAASKNVRLFFVEIHRRPSSPRDPGLPAYRQALRAYLREQKIPLISLDDRPELEREELFQITDHLNEAGMRVNTEVLADELLKRIYRFDSGGDHQ